MKAGQWPVTTPPFDVYMITDQVVRTDVSDDERTCGSYIQYVRSRFNVDSCYHLDIIHDDTDQRYSLGRHNIHGSAFSTKVKTILHALRLY